MNGWIGVDLDGTLAAHEGWDGDIYKIGPPVPMMLRRVRQWLADDIEVRIFTARAGTQPAGIDKARIFAAIDEWCVKWLGRVLPITATKDYGMIELWDDRAVQVVRDAGVRVDGRGDEVHLRTPGSPRTTE